MGNKILIVDDSPTELELMVDSLSNNGYEISTASNGDDAISKAKKEQPDLIVLDVVMPGKDGFQTCRELKKGDDTSHIKIVMVTSKNQQTDKFWGIRQGADVYLTKPFDPKDLVNSVSKLI